jgi:aspartate aminotransferase
MLTSTFGFPFAALVINTANREHALMKLAKRVEEMAESATLAVSAKAARMKAQGLDVVSFGAGEPDFDTPAHVKQAAIEALHSGKTKYPNPASGLASTKKAICDRLAKDHGLSYAPEQVVVTSGGKDAAYMAIHALIEPGDEVVIPAPYWVSYPEMVQLAGGRSVHVHGPEENDYKLTPKLLESAITPRTRMVILNSPSNPSGVTYHPDEIRGLSAVLRGRDLCVVSDEIYDRLLYGGQKTLSYAAVNEAAYAQTLTMNSASKTYAMTGWRLGYAAGPVEVIKSIAKLQSQSTSGAATFSQIAYAAALSGGDDVVETMRVEFERRGKYMWERLTRIPGVRCPRPTGAFYCFPNVSNTFAGLGVKGSLEFSSRLLDEANVAVVPGVAFGMDAHVRLSFATSMEQITKGLDRLESWLQRGKQ